MTSSLLTKAANIRLLILDVDGVLTSGALFYGPDGSEIKKFNVHDGFGMRALLATGVEIAIITARESAAVTKRMQDLKIKYVYQHCADKLSFYENLKKELQLADEQIAYVGDDYPDLPVLTKVGLAISVPNAPQIMHQHVHHVTSKKGGKGAVREVCDLIMQAQGTFDSLIQKYLSGKINA